MKTNIHKVTSVTLPHIITFHGCLRGNWQILFNCILNTNIFACNYVVCSAYCIGYTLTFSHQGHNGRIVVHVWCKKLVAGVRSSHSWTLHKNIEHSLGITPTNKLRPSMCYCFHEWLWCLVKYTLFPIHYAVVSHAHCVCLAALNGVPHSLTHTLGWVVCFSTVQYCHL